MKEREEQHERCEPFPLGYILAVALFLRITAILITLQASGVGLDDYLQIHDGRDYIAFAQALDEGSLDGSRQWVRVRFPGFPIMVYLLGLVLGKSWGIAGLFCNLAGAVLAVCLFDKIFKNRWATLYFSIFTPSWFLFSSINGTEGFFLFVNLLGLYLAWDREKPIPGYLVLGLSALVRPFAVFVILALLVSRPKGKNLPRTILHALFAGAPMLLWLVFCRLYYGSFLHNVSQYADIWEHRVLDWPFFALVRHSLKNPRVLKLGLVWGTVAFSLMAMVSALKRWIADRSSQFWQTLAWWQVFSCIFYFSLASSNPFTSIDRYILTALPAQVFSLYHLIPKKKWPFFILAFLTLLVFMYWNRNHFAQLASRA